MPSKIFTNDESMIRCQVIRSLTFCLAVIGLMIGVGTIGGCRKVQRNDRAVVIDQAIQAKKTKSDNLRDAFRYLNQLNPSNREKVTKEVLVQLNTWIDGVSKDRFQYATPKLYQPGPANWANRADVSNPAQLFFDEWDVDYLFQCKLMRLMSEWIVAAPVRDKLLQPSIDAMKAKLPPNEAAQFEEAYKLFDWTVRNVGLEDGQNAKGDANSVTTLTMDPREPMRGPTIGCTKLPWETALFSRGDYVERGRVFAALAQQRGIDTVWVSVNGTSTAPGYLWAIGVPIGSELYLFETKLGLPLLDPDTLAFATLKEARANDRILRRLDLPGQFEYKIDPGDLKTVAFLVDALPTSLSARMKVLDKSLLGADRMQLFVDTDALAAKLEKIAPGDAVAIWHTPLMARDFAAQIRETLSAPSQATAQVIGQYISSYGVWLMETPASKARMQHLRGKFESTLDEEGALSLYMKCRVDDESIAKLSYDPDIQKEFGLFRGLEEPKEVFEMRLGQAQMLYGLSKVDANQMLAQLHYDRGSYESTINWLEKRILPDKRAELWHAAGYYLLARAQVELDQKSAAETALTHQPSPQEPGNRLRLRLLRRDK